MRSDWNSVKLAIDSKKSELTKEDARREIDGILNRITDKTVPESARKEIQDVLRKASPWSILKHDGRVFIPSGQPTQQYVELKAKLKKLNIFLTDVGELEGFCRSVGNHGPTWVNDVLRKDLQNDPELREARDFVSDLLLIQTEQSSSPATNLSATPVSVDGKPVNSPKLLHFGSQQ